MSETTDPIKEPEPLEILDDFEPETPPSPRIKDYLRSNDAPSRYLMIISGIFAVLAMTCFTALIFFVYQGRAKRKLSEKHEVKQKVLVEKKPFHQSLGQYKIDWDDGQMRITVEADCSTESACDMLKERDFEVRDMLYPVLSATSHNQMLDPPSKLALRRKIAEKLEELNPPGQISEVTFSDLTIENKK